MKMRKNPDILAFRVTKDQKTQLQRMADLANQNISNFCRDAALAADKNRSDPSDEGVNLQAEIFKLLRDNQKMQYIIARLVLRVGAEQIGSVDEIMKYLKECQRDADEKYGEG